MIIRSTPEFDDWLLELNEYGRSSIDDRFDRIREHRHFGDKKHRGDALFELRWRNGRRVDYTLKTDANGSVVLMLLGGTKNGQKRDIAHARQILGREDA